MPFNKIGTKGITDGSIATAEFADGIVTSAKLQNSAVTNVKLTNTTVSVSGTSITLGSSATFNNKFVDWQSVIVADGSTGTTGVSGRGYFINTTSAAHTFTLPVSATRGDNISIKDYAGTFATYNLTIARNGHNIQGVANNSLISTNRASVVLVYVDVTRGWEFVEESNVANLGQALFTSATGGTVTTSGNFKIHTFTGDGTFVVSQLGNSPVAPTGGPANVDYLVVAGGGAGQSYAGGGGAGGYRTTFPSPGCNAGSFPITAITYPITVGGGGSAPGSFSANAGSPSIFSTITSAGGGRGGGAPDPCGNGGSGGGGGSSAYPQTAGTGNTPPVSPPQGNPGGAGSTSPNGGAGGGGGGAASSGSAASGLNGGNGGSGSTNSISGSPVAYAGGGGGAPQGSPSPGGTPGTGGTGGGGTGGPPGGNQGTAGTSNTGGGGGASSYGPSSYPAGGAGGKGIVIIRYKFQ